MQVHPQWTVSVLAALCTESYNSVLSYRQQMIGSYFGSTLPVSVFVSASKPFSPVIPFCWSNFHMTPGLKVYRTNPQIKHFPIVIRKKFTLKQFFHVHIILAFIKDENKFYIEKDGLFVFTQGIKYQLNS